MNLLQPSTFETVSLKRALDLWGVDFLTTMLVNGSLLFLLGVDQHAWSYSHLKELLVNLSIYGVLFLVASLLLTKGWETMHQPRFLLPLLAELASLALLVLAVISLAKVLILRPDKKRGSGHSLRKAGKVLILRPSHTGLRSFPSQSWLGWQGW